MTIVETLLRIYPFFMLQEPLYPQEISQALSLKPFQIEVVLELTQA